MAALAFKALHLGADKIPDKAFHSIPGGYFTPPNEQQNQKSLKKKQDRRMHHSDSRSDSRGDRHRHRRKSDDYSASESGGDSEDNSRREKPSRPTRRHRRYTSSQKLERGYDSDGLLRDQHQQSRGMPPPSESGTNGQFFPPPPAHAYEDGQTYSQAANATPGADGAYDKPPPQFRPQGGAYSPQQAPSIIPQYGAPPTSATYAPESQQWEAKRNSFNPSYIPHGGYANNYTAGYQPSQPYYPPETRGSNQGALAVQAPAPRQETGYSTALAPYNNMRPPQSDLAMNGAYPTYVPPQDNWTPSRSPSRDRSRRRRSKSRGSRSNRNDDRSRSRSRSRSASRDRHRGRGSEHSSKSRNRSRSVAAKAKEAFNEHRDVASGALGAVAGGLLGNKLGGRHSKQFSALAGAVLGGLGANYWEKQHAGKKKEKSRYDSDVVREIYEERNQQQKQREDKEQQHNRPASKSPPISDNRRRSSQYSPKSMPRDNRPPQVARSIQDYSEVSHRESSRHPYSRSNSSIAMPQPVKPALPHVRFATSDQQEYQKAATSRAMSRDLDARSSRAASNAMIDAATQTENPVEEDKRKSSSSKSYESRRRSSSASKSFKDHKKDYVEAKLEKEMPDTQRIYTAARTIKKAARSRRGTWDGSVVEEVFMEMTGVSVGHEDYMRSDWKN